MKVQFSFEVFDDYLKISISGENPYTEIEEILLTIKRLLEENKRTRVLIDALNLPDITDMEKFFIGELSAKILGGKTKFAMLRKPEHINKFMETVAVNRGARLYIVSDEKKALDWLLT